MDNMDLHPDNTLNNQELIIKTKMRNKYLKSISNKPIKNKLEKHIPNKILRIIIIHIFQILIIKIHFIKINNKIIKNSKK